jgi:hypothetical protein
MFDLWESLNEHRTPEGDQMFVFDPENRKHVANFMDMAEKFEWFRLYGARDGFLMFQQRLIAISFTKPDANQVTVQVNIGGPEFGEELSLNGFRILVIDGKVIFCQPIIAEATLSLKKGVRLSGPTVRVLDGKFANHHRLLRPMHDKIDRAISLIRNTSQHDTFFADVYLNRHDISLDLKLCPVGAYPDVDVETFKDDINALLASTEETVSVQLGAGNLDVVHMGTPEQMQPLVREAARRGARNPTGAQLVRWAWQMRISGGMTVRPVFLTPYVTSHQTEMTALAFAAECDGEFDPPDWETPSSRMSSNDHVMKTLQSLNFDPNEAKVSKTKTSSVADFFDMLLSEDED